MSGTASTTRRRSLRVAAKAAAASGNHLTRPTQASKGKMIPEKKKTIQKPTKGLTFPQAPRLRTSSRTSRKTDTMTTEEKQWLAIQEAKKAMKEKKKQTEKYREQTQGPLHDGTNKENRSASMSVRATGVMGIPTVRRKKLTITKEFQFQVDQRAASKPKRTFVSKDEIECKKKFKASASKAAQE